MKCMVRANPAAVTDDWRQTQARGQAQTHAKMLGPMGISSDKAVQIHGGCGQKMSGK
jgi:hypothetical protein